MTEPTSPSGSLQARPGTLTVPGFLLSAARPMQAMLERILRRYIAIGTLTVIWPDGGRETYGGTPGPAAVMRLHSRTAARRMLLDPTLALGELYMDGDLTVEAGTIHDLMDVMVVNLPRGTEKHPGIALPVAMATLRRRLDQYNPADRARRNVAHHYDLGLPLYDMFLDAARQYSCGYFRTGAETLDEAQVAKQRHIAAKLCLTRPGLHVLDIGCGWGGFALFLAREHGCRVTGITLSREQLTEARRLAEAEGLAGQVQFEWLDYRDLTGTFDRIVSVGMFEHVGLAHYPAFFDTLARCLVQDGVALLHTIGRSRGPLSTNRWLAKYIFPGGYSPALSEVAPVIERSGLIMTDIEILRLHYARTLRHWRERFAARRGDIAALYDERFCRMFEFYLVISELAFRRLGSMNMQIQLTRQQTAVPLVRDYLGSKPNRPLEA